MPREEWLPAIQVGQPADDRHRRGRRDEVRGRDPGEPIEPTHVRDYPGHRRTDDRWSRAARKSASIRPPIVRTTCRLGIASKSTSDGEVLIRRSVGVSVN